MRLQLTFVRDPGHVVHHPVDVEELRLLQQLDVVRGEGGGESGAHALRRHGGLHIHSLISCNIGQQIKFITNTWE